MTAELAIRRTQNPAKSRTQIDQKKTIHPRVVMHTSTGYGVSFNARNIGHYQSLNKTHLSEPHWQNYTDHWRRKHEEVDQ